jgi:hypothetical protein
MIAWATGEASAAVWLARGSWGVGLAGGVANEVDMSGTVADELQQPGVLARGQPALANVAAATVSRAG